MSWFKTKKLPKKIQEKPQEEEKQEQKETQAPKKRHISRWIIGISLFLITGLFAFAYVMNWANKDNSKFGSEAFQPFFDKTILSLKKEGTTNILIAGIGGKGHDGSELTDSIMLASLNGDDKKVTLLSIPRDLYIAYPGGKWAGKINSLYAIGKSDKVGVKYLADKVSEITGQQIDHYVVIDFSGFKKIIDILGGVMINVPEDLVDPEYPDDNWGYETLVIRKWLQLMDGELALKYARSRHSTSDFDRSNRQQIIIKAIKEKLFGADTITSPTKISEVFSAVMEHIDTDMTLAKMAETAYGYKSIKTDSIKILSLNNECVSLKQCHIGAYLYTPSRDLFGGASVIIPENARVNRLSYYDDIRRFVDVTFRYPNLSESPDEVVIVSSKANVKKAQNIGMALAKLWIPFSLQSPTVIATGTISQSHINIYWHADLEVGINPKSATVQALKYLEESLPQVIVPHNEYVTNDGPKIEIVLGDDIESHFPFVTPVYYIPAPPPTNTSGEMSVGSGSPKTNTPTKVINSGKTTNSQSSQKINTQTPPIQTSNTSIQPGEWEDFGN